MVPIWMMVPLRMLEMILVMVRPTIKWMVGLMMTMPMIEWNISMIALVGSIMSVIVKIPVMITLMLMV